METIGSQKIWSFTHDLSKACPVSNTAIRTGPGHTVGGFIDLAKKVAELQFRNRDYVLLFRGQHLDVKNDQGNSSFKPTLFRSPSLGTNPSPEVLRARFMKLNDAEQKLVLPL